MYFKLKMTNNCNHYQFLSLFSTAREVYQFIRSKKEDEEADTDLTFRFSWAYDVTNKIFKK